MKKLFFIVHFLIVLANALLILSDSKISADGHVIANIHAHNVDLAGEYFEATNRITRRCSNVTKIQPDSIDWNNITTEFKSKMPEAIAIPRGILKRDDWYLVEAELSNQEPKVFLFKKASTNFSNIQIFSGTFVPRLNAPIIRDYFLQNDSATPKDLVKCYDPFGSPFNE